MSAPRRSIQKAVPALLGLALLFVAGSSFADEDPPDRVARLSYLRGDVSFQPSGDDDWVEANLNRPLGTGDKLYTDRESRVEMEVGAATLRLDSQSSFDILNLDDNVAQTELTGGTLNLAVRRVFEGQSYEVDTPTLAFVVTQPGEYRIDIAPDGSSTMVTVFDGAGDVYGENNASYSVRSGQSYRFHDSALRDYEVLDLPRGDDFDNWVESRNNRYAKSVSSNYVSEGVIGYADLDDYGGWNDEPEYGNVWYPTTVETGWAPYRYGHWSWIDPWGWTWVDNAAWGFAPFHYGRWVQVRNRWGWCPGPRHVRAIYAPAMVAFIGGSGWGVSLSTGPVGWFPLGPRDVYVPWYRTSRNYFTNVNVRNTTVINNTYITNVYNNYSRGRPIDNANYAYRRNTAAVTAVSREAFVGARPVNAARVQVNASQLRNANVASRVGIAPERASFVGARPVARVKPAAQTLNRQVIARTQPPPRSVPVATRIQAIKGNNGQPLARTELRRIAAPAAVAAGAAGAAAANRGQPSRVRVVGQNAAAPKPLPARAPATGATPTRGTPANPAVRTPTTPNTRATTTPNTRTTPNDRATPNARTTPSRGENPNANGLPSSRFAPHRDATTGTPPSRTTTATPPSRTATPPTTRSSSPATTRTATPPTTRTTTPTESVQRRAPTTVTK
ncbi:MAG TPA: DUF6600 domain-containing protein, partial [Rhodanobacteraceae bacterium]|nr:DUF6600 domain-containing protein [Rhodanobacteraceae bacterium]